MKNQKLIIRPKVEIELSDEGIILRYFGKTINIQERDILPIIENILFFYEQTLEITKEDSPVEN